LTSCRSRETGIDRFREAFRLAGQFLRIGTCS
jgi:hypothetical protein